ncbi:MAG: helix-turn-helix transcriptional regulator [bacterium]|nr:helix-turn-helix transcriptional regulator [bacterium]
MISGNNSNIGSKEKQHLKGKIGERFRQMRNYTGLSQKEAGAIFGMNQSNIARIEKGIVSPNMSICHYFKINYNINTNWLISGLGDMVIKQKPKVIAIDYGEFREEMDDLFFHLDHVPEVRLEMLKFFVGHKLENKKQISEFLREQKVV